MRTARYGWLPQLPDHRDLPMLVSREETPAAVDLRPLFPPVWDQGTLGSCTGHACAAAIAYARTSEDLSVVMPSRLMLYYDARRIEGTTGADCGAQIRDVIKGAGSFGVCPEELWPYDPTKCLVAPTQAAYDAGTKDRALGYHSVPQDLSALRSVIAGGDPIVFGFSVYEGFESDEVARTGKLQLPTRKEALVGGHAVIAVGYDNDTRCFTVRNSWGGQWGDAGYFYMPYDYITDEDLASDFWTIALVSI